MTVQSDTSNESIVQYQEDSIVSDKKQCTTVQAVQSDNAKESRGFGHYHKPHPPPSKADQNHLKLHLHPTSNS